MFSFRSLIVLLLTFNPTNFEVILYEKEGLGQALIFFL